MLDRVPPPERWWRRVGAWLPPLLLVGVYLPGLVGGRIQFLRDIGSHELGWCRLWAQSVGHGRIPLWDPFTLGGTPMLANPNTLTLYPPMGIFLVLPTPAALAVFLLGHQLLLGLGTALLLHRLELPGPAVTAGAVAAAGSGIAFSQTAFLTGPAALAWLPFLLASAVAWPSGARLRWRRVAEAAAAGVLLLLAGKPVLALLGWVLWGVLLVAGRYDLRRLVNASAAPLLAAALAAPLLLPVLQVLPDSWRSHAGASAAAVEADSFAPRRWPEILLPRLYGRPSPVLPGGFWAAPSFPWQRYLLDLHLGTIPLLLMALSLRRRRAWPWLMATAVLSLLAAFPALLLVLRRLLPPLRLLRFAIKCLVPVVVVSAPAVALGACHALERPRSFRTGARWLSVILLPLLVPAAQPRLLHSILAALYPASAANLAVPGVCQAIARDLRIDLLAALVPLGAAALSPRRLLIPAMAVQLLLGGGWMLKWDSWKEWTTPPEAVKRMGPDPSVLELYRPPEVELRVPKGEDPVRWYFRRLRNGLARHYGVFWDLSYRGVSGPDGMEPAWMRLLAGRLRRAPPLEAARAARHLGAGWLITNRDLPKGREWSERYRIADGPVNAAAYRLSGRLPEVWMAGEIVSVPSEAALWRTLIDPEVEPGLRAMVVGARPGEPPWGGSCRLVSRRPGDWVVRVEGESSGLLVVNQADSSLWRARTEEGVPLPTVRVNGFLLGVWTLPGRHTVHLYIDGERFRLGLGIFLPALLITLLLAAAVPTPGRRLPSGEGGPTPPASPRVP